MIEHLKQRKLVRDVGKIFVGAGLGQAITFLAAPVLSRLYDPESFGLQSALLALVSPLVVLTSMAFPIAIVVARSDEDAAALDRLALIGGLVASPLAAGALLLGNGWLLHRLSLAEAQPYVWLMPLLVLATTLNMSASHHMTRAQAFGLMSQSSIAAAAISSLSKIVLGFLVPGALSLIAGNLIGYLVPSVMARRLNRAAPFMARADLARMMRVAREHRDFPLFRAPQNFVWTLAQSLPVIFLTSGFGPAVAGQYAVAMALAGAPVVLIGNTVQSVLYPRLTEAVQAGKPVSSLLWMATVALMVAGLVVFLPIVLFSADMFELILGSPWREAGQYAALLTPWLFFTLASRPAIAVIPALKLQRDLLIFEILNSGLKAVALVAGMIYLQTATGALLMFSISGGISYMFLMVWVWRAEVQNSKKTSVIRGYDDII